MSRRVGQQGATQKGRTSDGGKSATGAPSIPTFYRQVVAELRKVVWPTQEQLVTYFFVVMVFVLVMIGDRLGAGPRFGKLVFAVFTGAIVRVTTRTSAPPRSPAPQRTTQLMEQHVSEQYD